MTENTILLSRKYPREALVLDILLGMAIVLFLVGVFAPIFTFNKFFIFSNKVTLLSAVQELWQEGQYLLFLLIAGFSIVLPAFKQILLLRVLNIKFNIDAASLKHLHWIEHFGKWSMLDVFVVAMLLVTIKLGAVAKVEVHYGLFAFAISVILTMLVTHRITNMVSRVVNALDGR
jgi:paraquat-inducible protein A